MRAAMILMLTLGLTACAQSHPVNPQALAPSMSAPSTSMIYPAAQPRAAAAVINPVLAGEDAVLYAERSERTVFGAEPLAAITAYSIFTYDAQRISSARSGGVGYRYRWIVQQGLSVPLAP